MLTDIFGSALPAIVTNSFAQTYVLMAGLFNRLGRFFWASASDHLGRKTTYTVFFVAGIALYLVIPWTAHAASDSQALVGLILFYGRCLPENAENGVRDRLRPIKADNFGCHRVGYSACKREILPP